MLGPDSDIGSPDSSLLSGTALHENNWTLLGLAAVFAVTATTGSAKAGIIDEYLEKSKANKELNDKKRLATSGANFSRAYTVEFGSCQFPYNFTGCQDLAKQKKVPFITDDLEIECEGKEKYKCGSNVFWKW